MFALTNTLAAAGFVPERLEAAMLAACRAAGASVWYVADDFLVLGPELLSNGDFSQGASGWGTNGSTVDTSSGSCVVTVSTTSGRIEQSHSNTGKIQAGKQYLFSADIKSASNISSVLNVIRGGAGSYATISTSTTIAAGVSTTAYVAFTAPADDAIFQIKNNSGLTSGSFVCDNISVREIMSAKDFQDSAGTLPIYLGGTVGLGFDAAGSVGAEKNTLPLSSWTLPAGFTADGSTIVCTSASTSLSCYGTLGLATGKAHLITYTISEYSSGSVRPIANSGVVGVVRSANGTYTEIITPSAAAGNFGFQPWTTAFTGKITVNSVREVSGNHVTQATAGNRPIVSRIPRKLGPELIANGDFSGGLEGWIDASTAPSSISVAGGVARFNYTAGSTARLQKQVATQAGKSYQITGSPSANSVYLAVGTQSGGGQNMANAIAGASSVFTATSATTWVNYSSAIDGATIDNTSIREVLEWSYALTFDGSNDSLAAPASIIGATLTQPYTMIAWGRPASVNATRRVVGDNLRQLGIDAAGHTSLLHNTTGSKAGTYTHIAGQPGIIEAAWDGVNVDLRTNGVTDGSGALAAPGGTLYATCIGQGGAGSNFWAGEVGGVVVCPAVMTDAQRLAVRKFAAAQMGLTL